MLNRVMLIAGEASGDLHGSGVVRELKSRFPELDVFGVGGDRMKSEGMDVVFHISKLSFMGFVEVVKNLGVIREVEQELEELLLARKPDVLVLIDYPGFNLRFARKAKAYGIKVLYYISPQVWAWHKSRVKKMKTLVDRMKVVFPFEMDIYEREGIKVEFVGHPLAERIGAATSRQEFYVQHGLDSSRKLLALFPGSRNQEIESILPTMSLAAEDVQAKLNVQVAIGVAPNLGKGPLRKWIFSDRKAVLVENATYDLMCHADAAVVTSGTATLETGWFGTPMVVVYKTSPLTYIIGKMLVDVNNIGLVNIVAGEEIVPELIQYDLTTQKLGALMERMLVDEAYATSMRDKLAIIKQKLGGPGASRRVVDGIVELANAA